MLIKQKKKNQNWRAERTFPKLCNKEAMFYVRDVKVLQKNLECSPIQCLQLPLLLEESQTKNKTRLRFTVMQDGGCFCIFSSSQQKCTLLQNK